MSTRVALVMLLVMAIPAAAQQMTLEQVLDNYHEAAGGLEAWESVGSMKITGTMSLRPGMEVPFAGERFGPPLVALSVGMGSGIFPGHYECEKGPSPGAAAQTGRRGSIRADPAAVNTQLSHGYSVVGVWPESHRWQVAPSGARVRTQPPDS
ncbi:MAG: hypothetical protein GWN99_04865 [Gemmatimonadetes bacterium]|uniref:Uncharacterized protein n=1 Tax=Candidatus Kutchimonas denitrificans TaxID=3056748 RepID=A0AAE4ZAY3_9BACT|nr:hypothetical protein [Gemmatimonadota bacterium]NIR75882.1 hypothetical protein [Candidatus Kutchimonas denitrificans]NIS00394.1 hypothetical protein [Gemmatimonadota bacterium]NIT66058.1 hypothetical protein [Gemmatimonadota bacterium]NIU54812.1 hypothetical protein [Gemmatimonadota bacterium]